MRALADALFTSEGTRARRAGDLGTAVGEALALAGHDPVNEGLTLEKAESVAHLLASTGSRSEKLRALTEALEACTPLEGRYLVRAILGEMRVGAKEGIVEDAIAKAFERALEVAFDGLQKSERHTSGYALRFPRIQGIRDDKKPEDADTLDTVRKLYEAQVASGHREESTRAKKPEKKGGRKSGRRPDIRKKSKQLKLFDD